MQPIHVVIALAALMGVTAPSRAAPSAPRVVVVLEETLAGKRAPTSAAEAAVTSALGKDGWRLVAGDAAEKLRKAQAVSLALGGNMPDVLSSLDADLVLLGQVDVTKIGAIADAGLVAFRAGVTAKLVRVDTAEIVQAFALEAHGNDFTEGGAAQKAAKAAGLELAKAVRAASVEKRPRVIDLVVHGVPDRAQLEQLKVALARVASISNVVVRQSGQGLTKLEVSSTADAEALATQLETSGAPLAIVQTSAASILARHDLRRGVRLGARLGAVSAKVAGAPWLQGALAPLVESELANVAWLEVLPASADASDVTLLVSAAPAGTQIALTLGVDDARRRRLFTASATGPRDDVGALVTAAVKKLDEGFLPALARSSSSSSARAPEGGLARALAAARHTRGQGSAEAAGAAAAAFGLPELRIEALRLDSLFPAKLGHYASNPVGSVTVRHLDAKGAPATDVVVSVYVSRFMQLRTEIPVGTIAPGETKTVPLTVSLDPATVFAVEENTPTQAEVVVEYRASQAAPASARPGVQSARRIAPLVVYGRRAIDWSESAPIAAFVTPREENVRRFARAALEAAGPLDDALPQQLAQAVALYGALAAADLAYVRDPAGPPGSASLDTVQFARETLASRSGDCDDLAVLYASLLESVGVETAFLLVPGHVLVGVAAGVLPDAPERVTVDASRLVVHEGKAYVPVETTALDRRARDATRPAARGAFLDAWARGLASVASADKSGGKRGKSGASALVVVETRAGWSSYPPAALPRAAGLALPRVDPQQSAAAELRSVVAARNEERAARLAELAAAAAKDPAGRSALAYAAMLSRVGQAAQARAVLEAYAQKKPGDLAASLNLANVDVLAGDPAAAVGRYRAALAALRGQKRGEVLANLGLAYVRAGDTARAVDAFDAALADGAVHVFVASGFVRTEDAPASGGARTPVVAAVPTARASEAAAGSALERALHAVLERAVQRHAERSAKGVAAKAPVDPIDPARFAPPARAPGGGGADAAASGNGADAASRARAAELLRWWS